MIRQIVIIIIIISFLDLLFLFKIFIGKTYENYYLENVKCSNQVIHLNLNVGIKALF